MRITGRQLRQIIREVLEEGRMDPETGMLGLFSTGVSKRPSAGPDEPTEVIDPEVEVVEDEPDLGKELEAATMTPAELKDVAASGVRSFLATGDLGERVQAIVGNLIGRGALQGVLSQSDASGADSELLILAGMIADGIGNSLAQDRSGEYRPLVAEMPIAPMPYIGNPTVGDRLPAGRGGRTSPERVLAVYTRRPREASWDGFVITDGGRMNPQERGVPHPVRVVAYKRSQAPRDDTRYSYSE
jgi:hypothetical protein